MAENELGILKSTESIELTKTTKGYTWCIKLRADEAIETQLARLDEINNTMVAKYGSIKSE